MQLDDLLLTIAEVSMAFAGLVGIAGLFSSQARPDLFRAQFFLVVAMVGFALLAGLFAFLPFVVAGLGLSADASFRICSLILAIGLACWTAYGYARTRELRQSGVAPPRGVPETMIAISLIFVVALLLGSFGLLGGRTQGLYTACVFLLLGYSGYFFLRLVWSLNPLA